MCVEWNCHYFFSFICRIFACSCFVCLWIKMNKLIYFVQRLMQCMQQCVANRGQFCPVLSVSFLATSCASQRTLCRLQMLRPGLLSYWRLFSIIFWHEVCAAFAACRLITWLSRRGSAHARSG